MEDARASRDAGLLPTTTKKQWLELRGVREAKKEVQFAKQRLEAVRYFERRWVKEHKVQEALGCNPEVKNVVAAEKNLAKKEKVYEALRRDPQLVERAKVQAKELNAKIEAGKARVEKLAPAMRLAKAAEKELEKSRGCDSELEDKLGLELGRGRDRGMEL